MPDTITTTEPAPTRDEMAELIWQQRRTPGEVSIRIADSDGNSRDLDRAVEHWLAKGNLTRAKAEEAFAAIDTLRDILGMPRTT